MSKQLTLGAGFDKYAKTTRRARFLSEMERIVLWRASCANSSRQSTRSPARAGHRANSR